MTGARQLPAAFVTGGSSGIGLELAHLLAARGHPVALFARNPEKLHAAAAAIVQRNPSAQVAVFAADVGQRAACEAAVSQAITQLGAPSWAIANAGIAEPGYFLDQSVETHEAHMRVNYLGALYFAKAVAKPMTQNGGKLVFVASGAALFGIFGYSAYAPGKFALRGLAEVLRVELALSGISVSVAYPPDTETPMLTAENRIKPAATKTITARGGLWRARDVAKIIIRRADKGKFTVAPGFRMKALLSLHSIIGPALRYWQGIVVKKSQGQ